MTVLTCMSSNDIKYYQKTMIFIQKQFGIDISYKKSNILLCLLLFYNYEFLNLFD